MKEFIEMNAVNINNEMFDCHDKQRYIQNVIDMYDLANLDKQLTLQERESAASEARVNAESSEAEPHV